MLKKETKKLMDLTIEVTSIVILTETKPKDWADTLIPVNSVPFTLQIPKALERFAVDPNNQIALQAVFCEALLKLLVKAATEMKDNPVDTMKRIIEKIQPTVQPN